MRKKDHGGILLVEDDPGMLQLLTHAFRRAGFLVRTAVDEESALEQFFETHPAAVISDLILPAGEGMRTIQTMSAARPDAPIVVMSGGGFFDSSDLLGIAKAIGASAALPKPFKINEAIKVVSELLSPPLPELAA